MGGENRFLKDSKNLVEAFGGYSQNPLSADDNDSNTIEIKKETKAVKPKQPEPQKKITSINVDPSVFNKIKALAALDGITVSALLEQLMLDEIKRRSHKI